MENNNSEVHDLIMTAMDTLRKDFREQSALDRQDYRERADRIEERVESLRPCIVTRQSCDRRHAEIERRMVDKTYFAGGVAVLLIVIAVLGVILAVVRF